MKRKQFITEKGKDERKFKKQLIFLEKIQHKTLWLGKIWETKDSGRKMKPTYLRNDIFMAWQMRFTVLADIDFRTREVVEEQSAHYCGCVIGYSQFTERWCWWYLQTTQKMQWKKETMYVCCVVFISKRETWRRKFQISVHKNKRWLLLVTCWFWIVFLCIEGMAWNWQPLHQVVLTKTDLRLDPNATVSPENTKTNTFFFLFVSCNTIQFASFSRQVTFCSIQGINGGKRDNNCTFSKMWLWVSSAKRSMIAFNTSTTT